MLKPIRNTDQTSYCVVSDSAIDWDRMVDKWRIDHESKLPTDEVRAKIEREFWEVSVKDPAKSASILLAKPGESLTRFSIGVIPADVMSRIVDECKPGTKDAKSDELRWRAFLHGVRDIEGWPDEIERVETKQGKSVSPQWLATNFVRGLRTAALEVGFIIWHWNQLTGEEIKN